jgi:hypothetical protein
MDNFGLSPKDRNHVYTLMMSCNAVNLSVMLLMLYQHHSSASSFSQILNNSVYNLLFLLTSFFLTVWWLVEMPQKLQLFHSITLQVVLHVCTMPLESFATNSHHAEFRELVMFVWTTVGRMGRTQLRTCARETSGMSLKIVSATTSLQRRGTIQVFTYKYLTMHTTVFAQSYSNISHIGSFGLISNIYFSLSLIGFFGRLLPLCHVIQSSV